MSSGGNVSVMQGHRKGIEFRTARGCGGVLWGGASEANT